MTGHGLEAIVRAYQRRNLPKAQGELESFREMTLPEALSHAGLAERFDDKTKRWVRYDHQRRIPKSSLEAARDSLLAAPLANCRSFHELFIAVHAAIRHIPKIGELMVYDTSLRIGSRLGLLPDRVYLHAGTRAGARHLGFDWRSTCVERSQLPGPLRSLPAWQAEDVLCIFKDRFSGDSRRIGRCGRLTRG